LSLYKTKGQVNAIPPQTSNTNRTTSTLQRSSPYSKVSKDNNRIVSPKQTRCPNSYNFNYTALTASQAPIDLQTKPIQFNKSPTPAILYQPLRKWIWHKNSKYTRNLNGFSCIEHSKNGERPYQPPKSRKFNWPILTWKYIN